MAVLTSGTLRTCHSTHRLSNNETELALAEHAGIDGERSISSYSRARSWPSQDRYWYSALAMIQRYGRAALRACWPSSRTIFRFLELAPVRSFRAAFRLSLSGWGLVCGPGDSSADRPLLGLRTRGWSARLQSIVSGRQIPIAWASRLACRSIFVHDSERPWESEVCSRILGSPDKRLKNATAGGETSRRSLKCDSTLALRRSVHNGRRRLDASLQPTGRRSRRFASNSVGFQSAAESGPGRWPFPGMPSRGMSLN